MRLFSKTLQTLRQRSGLSARALAERSGLATTTITRIERNEVSPSIETVDVLARALGRSAEIDVGEVDGLSRKQAMAVLTASELLRDPDRVLEIGRRRVEQWRTQPDLMKPSYVEEWDRILSDWPAERIAAGLVSSHNHWEELRNVSPFAGAVPQTDRRLVHASIARDSSS